MNTITSEAVAKGANDLQQQLDEVRRHNALMARTIRGQRWAFTVAAVACPIYAVGGQTGLRTVQAQPVPPSAGVEFGPLGAVRGRDRPTPLGPQ